MSRTRRRLIDTAARRIGRAILTAHRDAALREELRRMFAELGLGVAS